MLSLEIEMIKVDTGSGNNFPLYRGLAQPLGTSLWSRPQGRPRTRRRDYISHLAWGCLGIPQEEQEGVVWERDIWNTLLSLLPLQPDPG